MTVVWILFVCSVVVLPATSLLALRWALRQGEFDHLDKQALSIFDDDEPVGELTDRFPGQLRAGLAGAAAAGRRAGANPAASSIPQ